MCYNIIHKLYKNMVTSNNKSTSDKDNWTDNLLIKDQAGKLHLLNEKDSQGGSDFLSGQIKKEDSVTQAPGMNTAPLDDNFAPIEYVGGKADSPSEFVFHPDDKQQLDEVAKSMPQDDSKKYSINKIVNKIIEKQGLSFDKANRQKFADILYDFFRDRKSAVVVRELLYIKVSVENKPLEKETVDNILSIVKGIKNKMFSVGGLVVRQDVVVETDKEPARIEIKDKSDEGVSAQEEVKRALKEIKSSFAPVPSQQPVKKELTPTTPKVDVKPKPEKPKKVELKPKVEPKVKKPEPKVDVKPKPEKPKKVELKPKVEPKVKKPEPVEKKLEALPKVSRPGIQNVADKKQVTDVVTKPKPTPVPLAQAPAIHHELTGPVQELEAITLDNFHRFGDVVQERIDKVLAKINILEKDSFTKKAQGIEAWRKSQVYKIYLELGQESMVQGKEVAALIEDYKAKDKSVLTAEEFSAISDLNKQLRF
jgi:hypothetical protein